MQRREERWRERFVEASLLRSLGAIDLVACRDAESGEARVLVVAAPDGPREETTALLAEIARQHELIDNPLVPRVAYVDARRAPACVALACSAETDLEALVETAIDARVPVGHPGAAAFALTLLETLDQVHRDSARRGAPVCMGAFSAVNVLVDGDGGYALVGWGHPFDGVGRSRLLSRVPPAYVAPETAFGAAPTPAADLAAVAAFFHSFNRLGPLPADVAACMTGDAQSPEGPLARRVFALLGNSHAQRPEDRSLRRFIDDLRPTLELLDVVPDDAAFRRDLAAVAGLRRRRASEQAPFVVARDGAWCRLPGGEVVPLRRRAALRRIVLTLAEGRRDQPGRPLAWEALLRAGWPDEKPQFEAARNRVHVAVAQLRSLGLRDVLVSHDAGYALDARVPLQWTDDGAPSGHG